MVGLKHIKDTGSTTLEYILGNNGKGSLELLHMSSYITVYGDDGRKYTGQFWHGSGGHDSGMIMTDSSIPAKNPSISELHPVFYNCIEEMLRYSAPVKGDTAEHVIIINDALTRLDAVVKRYTDKSQCPKNSSSQSNGHLESIGKTKPVSNGQQLGLPSIPGRRYILYKSSRDSSTGKSITPEQKKKLELLKKVSDSI
ncbi:hypothetical protein COV93_06255 [Candidatus Woesearchaeota archaeon CG11_big_fil_rev_8_21_14_0_20_43_8]|nr:MAG: hypothetical protein COV93_06255 [Candidatus Woesearchaeota archaeon CG11_big_fil_rev_8_21_14_0_20_43_8]PIO08513.1 MAG: hypothetical protein COT47_01225 [Candidatus Woesearchaeota archaeon CG08_land_8_20_14_0_20_43_7]